MSRKIHVKSRPLPDPLFFIHVGRKISVETLHGAVMKLLFLLACFPFVLFVSQVSSLSFSRDLSSRRAWLAGGVTSAIAGIATSSQAQAAPLGAGTPVGREIDTFLSPVYNFKQTDSSGRLDAYTLTEDSIPVVSVP